MTGDGRTGRLAVFSPVAIAAAYVIAAWAQSDTWLDALTRPLVVVVVLVGVASLLASGLLGRRVGSFVVLGLVLLALGIGYLLLAVAVVLGVAYVRMRTGRELAEPAISAVGPFAFLLLIAATVMAAPWSAVWAGGPDSEDRPAPSTDPTDRRAAPPRPAVRGFPCGRPYQ